MSHMEDGKEQKAMSVATEGEGHYEGDWTLASILGLQSKLISVGFIKYGPDVTSHKWSEDQYPPSSQEDSLCEFFLFSLPYSYRRQDYGYYHYPYIDNIDSDND